MKVDLEEARKIFEKLKTLTERKFDLTEPRLAAGVGFALCDEVKKLRWWEKHGQRLRNAIAKMDETAISDQGLEDAPGKMKDEVEKLREIKKLVEKLCVSWTDFPSVSPEEWLIRERLRQALKELEEPHE